MKCRHLLRRCCYISVPLLILLLFAVACGSGSEQGGGGQGGGESNTPIKTGMLLAMTGQGAFYGNVMSNGSRLATEEVNKDGFEGYKVELLIEDHESGDPDVAASVTQKFLNREQTPIILSSFTAPTLAAQAQAVPRGVPVINGGGIGTDLVGKNGLYNTRMLGTQLMPPLMEWAMNEYNMSRVATIFWNDAAGRAINSTVKEQCKELGCEVVAEEPHEVGAQNYDSQLARIRARNPEMLVIGSYGNDVGHIVSQARRQGLDVPIVGNEWTPDAQEIAGEAMEGYVATLDWFDATNPQDEQGSAFAKAYEEKYGEKPEFYGANYYDIVKFIIPQLTNKIVENGGNPTEPGAFLDAIDEAASQGEPFETVYGEKMVFRENGTVEKPAGLFRVENGQLNRFRQIADGKLKTN